MPPRWPFRRPSLCSRLLFDPWQLSFHSHSHSHRTFFSKPAVAPLTPLSDIPEAELNARLQFLREIGGNEAAVQNMARFKPLLLKKDLCKDLSTTLECLDSFGVDRSAISAAIGRLSLQEIDRLAKGVLVEKAKLLSSMRFETKEIASVLRASFRDVRVFRAVLDMAPEQPRAVLKYLENQGLDAAQCRALLSSFPILLEYSVETRCEPTSRVLHSFFGKQTKSVILSSPVSLTYPDTELSKSIEYLRLLVEDEKELRALLGKNLGLILERKKSLQQMVQFLETLGVDRKSSAKLLLNEPSLLECGIGKLRGCHYALASAGLSGLDAWHLLQNGHWALRRSHVRARLTHFLNFYKSLGFHGDDLRQIILANPYLLGQSLDEFAARMSLFAQIGLPSNPQSYKSFVKSSARLTNEEIKEYISLLTDSGLDENNAHLLLKEQPRILEIAPNTLREKLSFILHQVSPKKTLEDLLDCPLFLISDLEEQIKPRYNLVKWLMSRAEVIPEPSLSTYAELPEEDFVREYVDPFGEEARQKYVK